VVSPAALQRLEFVHRLQELAVQGRRHLRESAPIRG
jgi:hypothetical protein